MGTVIKVNIEDVRHGMIVGEDVTDQNGTLLAVRDECLGEEHIRAMRAFGVREVLIVSDDPEGDADDRAALLAATETRCRGLLRHRFASLDLVTPFGEAVFSETARRAAVRVLAEGLDLDAIENAPALSCLPPEQHLFGTRGIDPISLVSGEVELATLPEVHVRLIQALNSGKSTPQELAAIIGRDPSLTAKLLRLVNSPHYASRTPIDTISRAVSMVGEKELTTLVLGLAALSAFSDIEPGLCDMRAFWRHAAACGVYASLLAAACPGTSPDRVFVGGLLHDIGQLVILCKLPAAAGRALLLSRVEGIPTSEAETAVLGFDHAAVGQALLGGWNFPPALTAMVADHHHPDGRPESREAALVHIASILATAWAWPAFSAAPVPALCEAAWRSTGLSEAIIAEVSATGDARIGDIESVFFSGKTGLCQ
jgi:HD-like signal output (HDOD) protein